MTAADPTPTGRLVLAATPIGDPLDAPARLARLLAEADVVAAEDTRRLRRLTAALGVTPTGRVVSHHEHNEATSTPELVTLALAGATVALVTDAGMPSVSDPGYRLTRAMVDAGVLVTTVPGPVGRPGRARRQRAADRPVLLRGVPAAQGRPARPRARGAGRRAPHDGVLRGTAPLRPGARGDGGGVRPGPAGGAVPRADQDLRGGRARDARRAHRLGAGARGARRGEPGGRRGRPAPTSTRRRWSARCGGASEAGERLKDAAKAVAAAHGVPARGLYDSAVRGPH